MKTTEQKNDFFGLSKMNDHQLVNRYNNDLGNNGWTSSRAKFHIELIEEFDRRGIDRTAIAKENIIHLSKEYKAFLLQKTIYLEKEHHPETQVVIHYSKGESVKLKVQTVFIDEPQISLKHHKKEMPLLVIVRHDQLQTHIDGSRIADHRLAAFDHRGDFTAISVLHSTSLGTFTLLSQARTALIYQPGDLEVEQAIQSISIG